MNEPSIRGKAAAALLGLLVGGATGFLLTEAMGAFFTPVHDRARDGSGGTLPAAFFAVPILCALIGAVIGAHRAGRPLRQNKGR
ncbi:hypothetical protein ACTWQF_08125 [Streptomyces sp. 8N114]|uniref:hypothetical protein n=1 Tax=Streptomyces sp. 8N114 TaxID=3457419 RepID=UPI003FD41832